jgi:hypothetical protein
MLGEIAFSASMLAKPLTRDGDMLTTRSSQSASTVSRLG